MSGRFSSSSDIEKLRTKDAGKKGGRKSRKTKPAWHEPCLLKFRELLTDPKHRQVIVKESAGIRIERPRRFGDPVGQSLREWKYKNASRLAKILKVELEREGYEVEVHEIRLFLAATFGPLLTKRNSDR